MVRKDDKIWLRDGKNQGRKEKRWDEGLRLRSRNTWKIKSKMKSRKDSNVSGKKNSQKMLQRRSTNKRWKTKGCADPESQRAGNTVGRWKPKARRHGNNGPQCKSLMQIKNGKTMIRRLNGIKKSKRAHHQNNHHVFVDSTKGPPTKAESLPTKVEDPADAKDAEPKTRDADS